MAKLKIAVVIPRYGLIGGAETVVFELTERLAGFEDFEIHVFANRWRCGQAPVTFHRVPVIGFPRWLGPVSFALFARRRIRSIGCDIIHSHERIFEMDLFTFHGIPHATWIREARQKRLSLFDRATARVEQKGISGAGAPLILPVSNLVRDELLKVYDLPDSRIQVVHPGVSVRRFSDPDRTGCRSEIRKLHGLTPEDGVVLFVGMNFEIKRLDLVIGGLAEASRNSPDCRRMKLLVVGRGNTEKYRKLAQELGIAEQVIFAGVTREVEKYYLAADILAMPSHFDTFGLVVLEAMVAGLPVIISEKVGAKDLIKSGQNGFVLSDSADASEMGAVLAALADPDKRHQMGKNARKTAVKCDWDHVASQVAEIYRRLDREKRISK